MVAHRREPLEPRPDGSGYRLQSRFARFVNVPELMQQFRQVADVQTGEMLKLPVPKLDQGRPITISATCSPELKRFVDQLVKRTERIKSGKVDPRDDTGVEIDPMTAAIAQRLYPDGDIRSQGYESAALPNESFDLAISNVAFGDYKLHDQQFNDRTFSFTTTSSPRPSSTFGWAD